MLSGIGLGKFNPIDMKETAKARSKSSSFDSASSQEVAPRSNNSSVSQNKTLGNNSADKAEKNNSQKNVSSEKSEKKEFSQKVEQFSKKSEGSDKAQQINPEKLDKKQIKEAQSEIDSSMKNPEIPQMMMLQGVQPVFVNQQSQPVQEVKAADGAVDLNVKVSQQTEPVLKFLQAMQENFGISPQQVMKALGEMNPDTMMKSPQQAMTPLFEKLGIQPKQFTKAQILFTEMLTDMEKVNQSQAFNGKIPAAAAGGMGAMSTLQSNELPAQMIEKPMSAAPKSTLDQLIEQKISRRALEPQNMQGIVAQSQQPQMNMAQVFNVDQNVMADMGQESVALNKLQQLDPNLKIEDVKINPNRVSEQFLSSTPILGGGAAVAALANADKNTQSDSSEKEMKDQLGDQVMQMPGDKKIDGQFAMDKLGAPAAPMAALAGQPNQLSNENVEKLISGSQALIKKGGGEMKIQLNPEGLGTIHVDIKVKDGQVGVQMMADTHEAKKLLESSMSDLKVGLADHKLSLNHLKVDVADQASQNMNQNHDFKREEARDFLGQFRQFNEGFRQSGMDQAGARAYKKASPQASSPDINPIESKKSSRTSDGGLYLVA